MASIKKGESLQCKWKALQIVDGNVVDTETGAAVDVMAILLKYFKDTEFSLVASYKSDVELD